MQSEFCCNWHTNDRQLWIYFQTGGVCRPEVSSLCESEKSLWLDEEVFRSVFSYSSDLFSFLTVCWPAFASSPAFFTDHLGDFLVYILWRDVCPRPAYVDPKRIVVGQDSNLYSTELLVKCVLVDVKDTCESDLNFWKSNIGYNKSFSPFMSDNIVL